ncbi:MAG TPA: GH116 family glycosyl hydrolase, partial [Clostridia bacterium]|nr:GH116 family glycosyl hydrolase [Clostridia bacterium]
MDAVSANITVLRSTTCFRIEDGSFFGWEGCFDGCGCCDGNCTHVWNYAQTLAFLFPKLEQTMRRNEFLVETRANGAMNFRARIKLQDPEWTMYPALDGQCGAIVRLHREWRLSGEDDLIVEMGENALKALDFALDYWDTDHDGVPDSRQHNTYDIEFYGPNPLSAGMLLAALKAGEAIARQLGQDGRAEAYAARFREGSARADALLWGGEFYVQRLEDVDRHPYQHGLGCLSDQLFGQFMAHMAGLGYVLPEEHVQTALKSIYRYNFKRDLSEHESVQRCYALGKESGLVLCSWPQGGRPRFPFVYSTEVWTGIEYQVAA